MKTAIIVSGVIRNMINASSSWTFNGDYFLIADKNIYNTQSRKKIRSVFNTIESDIENCNVDFMSIYIPLDNLNRTIFLDQNIYHEIDIHPTINMAWKWKLSYNIIQTYHKFFNYDKILILRPDIFINPLTSRDLIDNIVIRKNTIYSTKKIILEPDTKKEIANDVFLLFDMDVFKKISYFYDYYIENYNSTLLIDGYDVHSLLAKFIIENDLNVSDECKDFMFTILRENVTDFMFENGKLKPEYDFWQLYEKNAEWLKNNIL